MRLERTDRSTQDPAPVQPIAPKRACGRFEHFSRHTARATGHPTAFFLAALIVAAWAITGPIFGFSDTWQLVINTGTTIVTFLMVFLLQASQNRESAAV